MDTWSCHFSNKHQRAPGSPRVSKFEAGPHIGVVVEGCWTYVCVLNHYSDLFRFRLLRHEHLLMKSASHATAPCCQTAFVAPQLHLYIYIMSTLLKFHSFLLKSPLSLVKHNEIPILDWCFTGIFGYFGLRHASHTMGIPWILRS